MIEDEHGQPRRGGTTRDSGERHWGIWKACCYLLEGDRKLYREVSAEVEPAIRLSREIIEELREDIQGLQNSNKDLQDDNRELRDNNRELIDRNNVLHQELESAFRGLVRESKEDGKSPDETVNLLMKIFSLEKEDAEKKVRAYWTEA